MALTLELESETDFDLAEIVERGMPTHSLTLLKDKGLSFTEISQIVISPRTLKHRKARKEPLSQEETDRMVRTTRIIGQAESVFGSSAKALVWLRTPDDRLADRTPMSLLHTEAGGRVVENLLWQVDEGIYS
jgi:putative toxin-antitoxin system antitoxin component (TIGR02293 family)